MKVKKISINDTYEVILCFTKKDDETFIEIYYKNKQLNKFNIIGCFSTDTFDLHLNYAYNDKSFIVYKYRYLDNTTQTVVTDILKFFDFKMEGNIIDTYQNLIDYFNANGGNLILDKNYANKKYAVKNPIKKDLKDYYLTLSNYNELNDSLKKVINSNLSEDEICNIIDLNDYRKSHSLNSYNANNKGMRKK